jgi:sorbitol-6-phosphate 2-dehydrogenase
MRLRDEVAIISGAGQGIGKAIALKFAGEGADIVAADINLKSAEKTADEVAQRGRKAVAVRVDVTKEPDIQKMTDKSIEEFGKIDILVNNAGMAKTIRFLDMTGELWDAMLDINLKSVFLCCKAVLPHMLERKKGRIINMSSKAGKVATTWFAAYSAAKAGVIALTQSLALDVAREGINVNCICPGIIFTPHWNRLEKEYAAKRNMNVEDVREYLIGKIPQGRPQTPEDVANVALFLASQESGAMTGQAINVTGGQEMR